MKKSRLIKALSIVAGIVMVMSMSVSAFADNVDLNNGVADEVGGNPLNISKTLTVSNPVNISKVAGPGITYSYTLSPVDEISSSNGGTTVSDGTNTTTVKPGVENGVSLTTDSVSWLTSEMLNCSTTGAANVKNIVVAPDVSRFTIPGIYRYQIVETSNPSTTSSVGVTDNGDKTRYLDVYVENTNTGLAVSGYVVHDAQNNKKTFDNASFETVNTTLTLAVDGNLGDKNHSFPFAITVSDNNERAFSASTGTDVPTANPSMTNTQNTTLKDGETYHIYGLLPTAKVAYTETNDTADTYSVNYTGGTASPVAPNETKAMPATSVEDAGAITFTNSLDEASPTGIQFRFLPPVLILLAGIALIAIFIRTKKVH